MCRYNIYRINTRCKNWSFHAFYGLSILQAARSAKKIYCNILSPCTSSFYYTYKREENLIIRIRCTVYMLYTTSRAQRGGKTNQTRFSALNIANFLQIVYPIFL